MKTMQINDTSFVKTEKLLITKTPLQAAEWEINKLRETGEQYFNANSNDSIVNFTWTLIARINMAKTLFKYVNNESKDLFNETDNKLMGFIFSFIDKKVEMIKKMTLEKELQEKMFGVVFDLAKYFTDFEKIYSNITKRVNVPLKNYASFFKEDDKDVKYIINSYLETLIKWFGLAKNFLQELSVDYTVTNQSVLELK